MLSNDLYWEDIQLLFMTYFTKGYILVFEVCMYPVFSALTNPPIHGDFLLMAAQKIYCVLYG